MVNGLPASGLFSHPGIPLEEHLKQTAALALNLLQEKPIATREKLTPLLRTIALVHDLGKATTYFQEYLNAGANKCPETHHSLFSAVCAYYLAREVSDGLEPVFAFLAVRRHHGDLRDIRDEIIFNDDDKNLLYRQLESIPDRQFDRLIQHLLVVGLPAALSRDQIADWINSFQPEMRSVKRLLRKNSGAVEYYITLNLLYSLLLDADKSSVVIKNQFPIRRLLSLDHHLIKNYRQMVNFPPAPINRLRDSAYHEVTDFPLDLTKRIYSLNLPTGLGKTISALTFALRLRKYINTQTGTTPRIIYSLPYLSIIEQNAKVIRDIFQQNNIPPDSDILLEHHHLSDIFYQTDERIYEPAAAEILIEGWNSELIITTFVQLFHTIFSNRNRALRKFHRLANSIVILDEVQTIPVKYWHLLRMLLEKLTADYNVFVIFITATEPQIFSRDQVQPLIKDRNYYFNALDRVRLMVSLDQQTVPDFIRHLTIDPGKSYLIVLNTIKTAQTVFKLLRDEKGISCSYLSTHLTPHDRLQRINEIRAGRHRIAVTTQLVEAGVDIDFDVVIRDFAPLDCIIQAAGRCNRQGKRTGEVRVVTLIDDHNHNRLYASYIYDPVLLDITRAMLADTTEIPESSFPDLINRYYQEVQQRKSQDESTQLLEALKKLRYDTDEDEPAVAKFALIPDEPNKYDVFIEQNDDAASIWQQFTNLKDNLDPFKRRRGFQEIKARFYQYLISVPRNISNQPEMVGEIGYVKKSLLKAYYDEQTGFIIHDPGGSVIL